jgi:hypothetical protein
MVPIRHASPKRIATVRIGFEVLVDANIRKIPGRQEGSGGTLWAKLCSVKQASWEGPIDVWMRIGALNI